MENKKKKLLLIGCIIIIGLIAGTYFWSTKFAPANFQLTKVSYANQAIPEGFDGFKIALISDFDLKTSEDLDYLEKCVNKLNKAQCDMVIFSGDIFENAKIFSEDRLISILKAIDVQKGKLAVLGENELKTQTDKCIQILEESGFEVLRNTAHYIYSNNDRIVFAGLENSTDLDSILTEEMKNTFILSAIHQPDFFTKIQKSVSQLQLSGHSGGGFIKIPLIGSLIKFDGSETYQNGTTTVNNHTLMISNGIGMGHDQNARFMCNPEALIITLRTLHQ